MPQEAERPNVLVIGGAGFIGSHLCEYLLTRANVICVDNYSSGQESNIDHLLSNPHFEFVRHDITEPLDFRHYPGVDRFKVGFIGVQEIYHLACAGSPRYYLAHPLEVMTASAQGTRNVLDIAVSFRSKVLFGSDILVYGKIEGDATQPNEEYRGDFDHLLPENWYAESKRYAESLIEAYRMQYSLTTKIVRLFGVYGPNMAINDGRVVPEYIQKALEGKPLVVPKDRSICSFCYIDDAVSGLTKIMELEESGRYNLGQSVAYQLSEVAQKIITKVGSSSQVVVDGDAADADQHRAWVQQCQIGDTAKVRHDAEWFPLVLLDEGLDKTIDYLKSRRGVTGIGHTR